MLEGGPLSSSELESAYQYEIIVAEEEPRQGCARSASVLLIQYCRRRCLGVEDQLASRFPRACKPDRSRPRSHDHLQCQSQLWSPELISETTIICCSAIMMTLLLTILALTTTASSFRNLTQEDNARRTPTAYERAQTVLREKQLHDTFNATEQFVSTTGRHQFIAPSSTDLRGPCPFLNAAANHGYIDRSGYTTAWEVTSVAVNVFGMGTDLATFLSSYAAIVHGDSTAFSIGGTSALWQAGTSAGQHTRGTGLSGSHNSMECDGSPISSDTYGKQTLSAARLEHLKQLFGLHQHSREANYDMPTLTDFRAIRQAHSIAENKLFFNGPFTGLIMQPASYSFMYRLLANHSAGHPAGHLTQDVLKSFYAITTEKGKMKYTPGHERIPHNWYRRSRKTPYNNHFLLNDVIYQASHHPQFFRLGGNIAGKVKQFRPIDIKAMTSNVYRAATLHEDWNFAFVKCQSHIPVSEIADIVIQLSRLPSCTHDSQ
jgi:hypothetical protein